MVEELAAVISGLAELPPEALADESTVLALYAQLSRLEAVASRATASWDASQGWREDGAQSGAAWLAARSRLPRSTAQRRVRLGRAIRHLPVVESAWLAGRLDASHVGVIVAKRRPATEEAMTRDEELLVRQAQLSFRGFCRALNYWDQINDPDGADGEGRKARDGRLFRLSQSFEGKWFGDMVLDPVSGTIVDSAVRRIERELFEADWVEARDRLGREPTVADLARTATQRRGDALVGLCRRAMTAPADGRRPAPLFTVLVGYETFHGRICELADGTVVAPGSLVPWLSEADVERVVFDGPSRVIDVGVTRRLFTGATRRAVEVRDRECFHDFCEEPAQRCQVDHIEPHAWGGLTMQGNGRLACGLHNRGRCHPSQGP